jgi:pimeloyl-ACP methyl ester carboxylesterase
MAEMFQHAYANLGDVRLHYVTAGRGPAVVLLHGWPQTWYMWRDVIPGLAGRHRVIAPDLRGLGDSSRPVGGTIRRHSRRMSGVWFMTFSARTNCSS